MIEKTKIVYIISTLYKCGPVNVLYDIIKHLDKDYYDITVITLSPEKEKHSRYEDFKNLRINVKSLKLSRLQGYLYGGFVLLYLLNKIKPDIVHTHCFRSTLLSVLFLGKYKRITTVHNDYKEDSIFLYGRFLGFIIFILSHLSYMLIRKNICCSEILSEILHKRYNYLNFDFINNGIDTDFYAPSENKYTLREKLELPQNKKVFVWACSFIERKNPLLLLNVIKDNIFDDCYFIFCGTGPLLQECKEFIKNNDNIKFYGQIDNVLEFFQASDYYISTSISEGLPLSVVEAMSCGLPVILSDIEQHKYILGDSKVGKLFKLNDREDLIKVIKDIMHEDYSQYSRNARHVVETNFSSKLMSENYQKNYKEMIKK